MTLNERDAKLLSWHAWRACQTTSELVELLDMSDEVKAQFLAWSSEMCDYFCNYCELYNTGRNK